MANDVLLKEGFAARVLVPCMIEVDLSGVTATDSAGLALLLEWITWANHTVREIRFLEMPTKIDAIARTTEVEGLLRRGERWAGFIDAPTA